MKKLLYFTFSLIMLLSTANLASATEKSNKTMTIEQQVKLTQFTNRVEEIRSLDKSQMNRQDKRALRAELKEMKSQANAIGNGGVYLSVTALLLIIILLILIF